MTAPQGLHQLARLHDVQTAYHDHDGNRITASPETLMAALRALGAVRDAADVESALARRRRDLWERAIEPVVVAWLPEPASFAVRLPASAPDATLRVEARLEEGGERAIRVPAVSLSVTAREELAGRRWVEVQAPLPDVPAGYHDLHVEVRAGDRVHRHRALLVAAPRRTAGWEVLPGGPAWGVFAPLHGLWEADPPERTPDFGHLDRLAERVAGLGGSVVGTLPLLATFIDGPHDPSPYSPVSRLFWNELYVDPAADDAGTGDRGAGGRGGVGGSTLDYRALLADRRGRLDAAARAFYADRAEDATSVDGPGGTDLGALPETAAFMARNPRAADYARFRAMTEELGPWTQWPDRLRARDVRPGDYDLNVARYHLYAQWRAEQQLATVEERAAASGVSLYLDLPLGVHPHGYDVWRERELFVLGATAGAPPDPLAPEGQDWGFHPPHPERSRRDGHRYFIATIRKHLRYARVLRIDHVMQLHRLFWAFDGSAADGVYVRYPHEELYAILSLESHRAGAVIVGEDLGTVPRRVRRELRKRGMPGMYVVQFALEDDEEADALVPARVPEDALAAIGTHDTPMFAAWWTGRDAEVRQERGLLSAEAAETEVAGRAKLREKLARGLGIDFDADVDIEGLGDAGDAAEDASSGAGAGSGTGSEGVMEAAGVAVQEALYRILGRSEAGLVLATMEDLWMETEPQNVPGTPVETNWRRRCRRPIGALTEGRPARLLAALNEARGGGR